MKNQSIANNIDWISIIIYALLVILGWLNIYSSSLSPWRIPEKQLIFIVLTIPLIFIVLSVDGKFYEKYATIIFGISLLTGLFLFGNDCRTAFAGNRKFTIQPSEFAKSNIISIRNF
jgi:rod shape determining protein RodA